MSELPGAAPATDHDEGSPRVVISGLNRTAFDLAFYASQGWLPTRHARLASGCWSGSTGRDWLPAGFHLKGFKLPTILLSRAFLREISSPWSSRWFEAGSAYDHHTIAMCKEPCEVEALARAVHCFKMPSLAKSPPTCDAFRRSASAMLVTPMVRSKPIVAFRKAAITSGPERLRIRLASSPIVTSRT